jgi:hypothetical protein
MWCVWGAAFGATATLFSLFTTTDAAAKVDDDGCDEGIGVSCTTFPSIC